MGEPDHEPDGDGAGAPTDLFGGAADGGAAERAGLTRRGPGRPKGATNRHTAEFEAYYFTKGYKDPLIVLGEIITAHPLELWAQMREWYVEMKQAKKAPGLMEIIQLQRAAAVDLAPYLHGKKPIQHTVSLDQLPTLMLALGTDQLSEAQRMLDEGGALALAAPLDPSEINGLDEGVE